MSGQNIMDSPQAIFTSFKLPKPSTTPTPSSSKDIDMHDSNDDRSSTHSPVSKTQKLNFFCIHFSIFFFFRFKIILFKVSTCMMKITNAQILYVLITI